MARMGDTQHVTPPMLSSPSSPPMDDPSDPNSGETKTTMPEPPRNRMRPAESDEQRANAPRTASERWARRIHGDFEEGEEGPRLPSKFELGPSSLGRSRFASENDVDTAIRRREMYARHRGAPLMSQLVRDRDFYRMLNASQYEGQIRADWPEIQAGGARESAKLLKDLSEQYEDATGVSPIWD